MTVSTPVAEVAGVCDVTLSLPHLLGGEGVVASFPLPLSQNEEAQLQASVQVVSGSIQELET